MTKIDNEDKFFAILAAIGIVVISILVIATTVSILIAMWEAGLINFVVWTIIFTGLYYTVKAMYKLLIRNDKWM